MKYFKKHLNFEDLLMKQKKEYSLNHSIHYKDKLKIIKNILEKNKLISAEEINILLNNYGFELSNYENIFIYNFQLGLLKNLLNHYNEKNELNYDSNDKINDKKNELIIKIKELEKNIDFFKQKYETIFPSKEVFSNI